MQLTEGYPDSILGSWRGSSRNNQPVDDQTIYTIIPGDEENRYLMKITTLGPALKKAKYHKDEIIGWINPSGEPGFYEGKFKLRYMGTGLQIFAQSTIEITPDEELHHHHKNGEISIQYRVRSSIPSKTDPINQHDSN